MKKEALIIPLVVASCFSSPAALVFGPTFSPGSATSPGTGLVDEAEFHDSRIVAGQTSPIGGLVLTLKFSSAVGLDWDLNPSNASTMSGGLDLTGSDFAGAMFTQFTYIHPDGDSYYYYVTDLTGDLGDFAGKDPNGTWSLTLGMRPLTGAENTLVSWSLDITAVPEPAHLALCFFGLLAGGVKLVSWRREALRARAT